MPNSLRVFGGLVLFDLWIPDSGFRIPDSGFRFQILVFGFRGYPLFFTDP